MKILWVSNVPLPEASLLMNEEPVPFGGWLINAAKGLSEKDSVTLGIAFPKNGIKKVKELNGENINYFIFPSVDGNKVETLDDNPDFLTIVEKYKPDIVHIFGTEYPHTLAMVNICKKTNIHTVITIQGLVSFIAKHYTSGLPERVQKKYTFRDFVRRDNIKRQQKKFAKRGEFEMEALQKVNHVIGRSTWDRACTSIINPNIKYHYCNDTLRDPFYNDSWEISQCELYSIFVSQGSYPIKGLHIMLEAMPMVLKRFPRAKLYIGGPDISQSKNLKQKLRISSYGKYIKELIQKYRLESNVIFTGMLDEEKMCKRYLQSHVFVCPSTIENSPNSLGEAMLLGVPSISADVGGVTDLLKHQEEGFVYQADASYMLAHYICEIFGDHHLAMKFSERAKADARKRYDRDQNKKRLFQIYQEILMENVEVQA